MAEPASERTRLRRGANRAVYEPAEIRQILRAGLIAHVGVNADDGPVVLPMAYGLIDDRLFIHGAVANAMMRAGSGVEVCVTVTIVDGLVVARTPFHNSMNYRSVVVRGTATPVTDPQDKVAALRAINDHAVPIWDTARQPSDSDLRKTMVLAISLTEASAKVRGGDPIDEEADLDGPHWAGVVPLNTSWGQVVPAGDLRADVAVPPAVAQMQGEAAYRS